MSNRVKVGLSCLKVGTAIWNFVGHHQHTKRVEKGMRFGIKPYIYSIFRCMLSSRDLVSQYFYGNMEYLSMYKIKT